MNRPRLIRWLRISVSAICALAGALLIGLAVSSYLKQDFVFRGHSPNRNDGGSELSTCVGTYECTVYLWHGHTESLSINGGNELNWESGGGRGLGWHIGIYNLELSNSTKSEWEDSHSDTSHLSRKLQWSNSSNGDTFICVPHWLLILLAASLGTAVWIPWSTRFSLRTLLIVTTLVAMVLGFVVYAVR